MAGITLMVTVHHNDDDDDLTNEDVDTAGTSQDTTTTASSVVSSNPYSESSSSTEEDVHFRWEGWDELVDDPRFVFFMEDGGGAGQMRIQARVPREARMQDMTLHLLRWLIRYTINHSSTTTTVNGRVAHSEAMEGTLEFVEATSAVFHWENRPKLPCIFRCIACFRNPLPAKLHHEAKVSGTITRKGKAVKARSRALLKEGTYDIPAIWT